VGFSVQDKPTVNQKQIDRGYPLLFLLIHIKTRRGRPKTKPPAASRGNRKAKAAEAGS